MPMNVLLWVLIVVCSGNAAVSAEALQKRKDADGNLHFGTSGNPNLCCMCQPALEFESHNSRTIFLLRYGLERAVANESVYLSLDNSAWYCEGYREMGKTGQKCGLIPQAM